MRTALLHPQLLSHCRMRRDRDPPRESAPSHRLRLCRLRTRWPTFYGIKDAQRAILRGSTCANTSTNYSVNRCEKAQDLRNIPVVFILHAGCIYQISTMTKSAERDLEGCLKWSQRHMKAKGGSCLQRWRSSAVVCSDARIRRRCGVSGRGARNRIRKAKILYLRKAKVLKELGQHAFCEGDKETPCSVVASPFEFRVARAARLRKK